MDDSAMDLPELERNRPPEDDARLGTLAKWAQAQGLPAEAAASFDRIVDWAKGQGFAGATSLDDVVNWASDRGLREVQQVEAVKAFSAAAAAIPDAALEGAEIAAEAGVELEGLVSAWGGDNEQAPEMVLLSNAEPLTAMLRSTDEQLQTDVVTVLGSLGGLARQPAALGVASAGILKVAGEIAEAPAAASKVAKGSWSSLVSGAGDGVDVNALVQAVLRESYMQGLEELAERSKKVKFYNDLKKKVRDEINNARQALTDAPTDSKKAEGEISIDAYDAVKFETTPAIGEDGKWSPRAPTPKEDKLTNKEALRNYIQELESDLSSMGDDAQLANVDLQNVLQRQQQTMQSMSNISKMLHDTAMSIIRKLS
jgi:hypothetical protein